MAIETSNLVQAAASIGLVGGLPAVIRQIGFSAITFPAPGVTRFVLEQAIDGDEITILATGRRGWIATAQRIDAFTIEVTTVGGSGIAVGAFDLEIAHLPAPAGTQVTPDPDPLAPPLGGGAQWQPPVFVVSPVVPQPAGTYPTITAAIAAAVAAGYGGIPLPAIGRALVLVLPGVYTENPSLIAGIDVCALDQSWAFQATVIGSVSQSFGPGGNSDLDFCIWRGVDIQITPGFPGFSFSGPNPQKLYLSQMSIEGPGVAFAASNTSAPQASKVRAVRVTLRPTTAVPTDYGLWMLATSTADIEIEHLFCRRVPNDLVAIAKEGGALQIIGADIDGQCVNGFGLGPTGPMTLSLAKIATTTPGIAAVLANGVASPADLTTLGSCLLLTGGDPVGGAGVFAYALVSSPALAGAAPFGASTYGGAGPLAGRVPVAYTAGLPATWTPPAPTDYDLAIDRLAFRLALLGPPLP